MVCLGCVEELTVVLMRVGVVLRFRDVKIWDPAKFTVNVSLKSYLRIVRHPGPLGLILNVGVFSLGRGMCDILRDAEWLIKELLINQLVN